jgi:hypothetical protein
MLDHFWDFDRLDEDGVPRRSGDHRSHLFCGPNKGFIRDFVLGFWDVDPWVYP